METFTLPCSIFGENEVLLRLRELEARYKELGEQLKELECLMVSLCEKIEYLEKLIKDGGY